MWAYRLGFLSSKIPRINDDLLRNFRQDKIENIPQVLEGLFKQTIDVIANHMGKDAPRLKYIGFRELTPDERVNAIRTTTSYAKNYSIRPSLARNLEFIFEFMEERYTMNITVPYVDNYCITIDGTAFYPLFTIVEKGGMYRNDNMVILQVMRAKLCFWREKTVEFTSVEGGQYNAINITAKLHQASRGKKNNPPLILHHLANHGFNKTIKDYGFKDIITLTDTVVVDNRYQHIKVKANIYLRITIKGFDINAKRMVVGLLTIYNFWKKFEYKDLFDKLYYIYATGKWAYPRITNPQLMFNNTTEYIHMNRTILDPVSKDQHASIGIVYDDLDGLMIWMFNNIDYLVVDYNENSTNLYIKKIGVADQMLSSMIRNFNVTFLDEVINNNLGIRPETVKRLMYPKMYSKWVKTSPMFRGAPMIYNDNYLLNIGKTRFRTTANTEISQDQTGNNVSFDLLKADPSFMAVESILAYPSSNPVISGSINPFLQVAEDGCIIEPEWSHEIKDVFDK